MDRNQYKKHIIQNSVRRERSAQGRLGREKDINAVDMLLSRQEMPDNNVHYVKCGKHETKCENVNTCEAEIYNIERLACRNDSFRERLWTGRYLQTTLMSICRGGETGAEMHADADQYIRVEHGCAVVFLGELEDCMTEKCRMYKGDCIFIPAGTYHNVANAGRTALKLSTIYAPVQHK